MKNPKFQRDLENELVRKKADLEEQGIHTAAGACRQHQIAGFEHLTKSVPREDTVTGQAIAYQYYRLGTAAATYWNLDANALHEEAGAEIVALKAGKFGPAEAIPPLPPIVTDLTWDEAVVHARPLLSEYEELVQRDTVPRQWIAGMLMRLAAHVLFLECGNAMRVGWSFIGFGRYADAFVEDAERMLNASWDDRPPEAKH